jgi:haloacetate dehalogenase
MAADMVAVLDALGVGRTVVVGHDRGGRVAHRFALDHADRLAGVAFLDILPTLAMFERVDRAMATAYFHWFFLARPAPLPERLVGADPDAWLDSRFTGRHAGGTPFDPRAIEAYRSAFRDPATIHASCEDYRAAATVDLEHDRADREAGRFVDVPVLVAWGKHGYVGRHHDPLQVWRAYVAGNLVGGAIDADHYLAEEAPAATIAAIRGLLSSPDVTARRR